MIPMSIQILNAMIAFCSIVTNPADFQAAKEMEAKAMCVTKLQTCMENTGRYAMLPSNKDGAKGLYLCITTTDYAKKK